MPAEKITQSWRDIIEKVINDFIGWLVNDSDLNEGQQKSLEVLLTDIKDGKPCSSSNIVDLVAPILNVDQKDKAIGRFAELFVANLESFYTDLKRTMTQEQKKVADSYIQLSYDRNS